MSKAERIEKISNYLKEEGWPPQLDQDGDILFKSEGRTYLIEASEDDELFYRIIFPQFWPIESDQEGALVSEAANFATRQTKVAKVFPIRGDVWATVELFCSSEEDFKAVFKRSMGALQTAINGFVEKMRENKGVN